MSLREWRCLICGASGTGRTVRLTTLAWSDHYLARHYRDTPDTPGACLDPGPLTNLPARPTPVTQVAGETAGQIKPGPDIMSGP